MGSDYWHWPLVIGSLIGVVLNIKHDRRCFWIWAVTNAAWCVIDFQYEIYSQSALNAVYFALAIWGIVEWRKNKTTA